MSKLFQIKVVLGGGGYIHYSLHCDFVFEFIQFPDIFKKMSVALTLSVLLQSRRDETKGGRLREVGEVQSHLLFMGEI